MSATSIRVRMERGFERWGHFVIRQRWPAIVITLLLTALCMAWIPRLKVDNSTESFLHPDDPASMYYNQFRAQFDRDDRILIAIKSPKVFSLESLEKLRALHEELEAKSPYVEEIVSLVNARYTRAEGDEILIGELMEEWPTTQNDVDQLRQRVLANPLYRNVLISDDEQFTTITIKPFTYSTRGKNALQATDIESGFEENANAKQGEQEKAEILSEAEMTELVRAIESVLPRYAASDFQFYLAGGPIITDRVNTRMFSDVSRFLTISMLFIVGLLFLIFRQWVAALAPVLIVAFSVLATFGLMVVLKIPGSISLQILPSFLLTVGICDSIHILTIVYQRLNFGDSREEAIVYALGHSGIAVLMTSATTAVGLASFITAELAPISHLGIIAPIGVMLAFLYTVVLLPALLSIFPLKAQRQFSESAQERSRLVHALTALGDFGTKYSKTVIAGFALLLAISLAGATQARFSHSVLMWFPEQDPLRVAMDTLDESLRGTASIELILDTGKPQGLKDPATLRKIESAMQFAEGLERGPLFVGKAMSIVDVVKELNQALHENDPAHYVIPDNRDLITQELLLFENSGSDDMEEIVDSEYRVARVSLRVPLTDAMLYQDFVAELQSGVEKILGAEIKVHATGLVDLLTTTFANVVRNMARSNLIAFLLITPMMVLLVGHWRRGLLSMIPNILPVVVVIGVMGWFDIPFDAATTLIGAIIIGLSVDDTIHFMYKFQRYSEQTGNTELAVQKTIETTGAAMFFTSVVLCGGFFVFLFAYLKNGQNFGLLAGIAIIVALLADLVFSPAALAAWGGESVKK